MDALRACPDCGKKATTFDKNGNHNFCPASKGDKVVEICMECKMKEIKALWNKNKTSWR